MSFCVVPRSWSGRTPCFSASCACDRLALCLHLKEGYGFCLTAFLAKIKIGTNIIPEMQRKCALLKVPRGYALEEALISLYGPDNSLKDTGYFHHFVTLDDII